MTQNLWNSSGEAEQAAAPSNLEEAAEIQLNQRFACISKILSENRLAPPDV